jgi:hypothetical protein
VKYLEVSAYARARIVKVNEGRECNMAIRDAVCFSSGKALLSAIDQCGKVKNPEVTHMPELELSSQ